MYSIIMSVLLLKISANVLKTLTPWAMHVRHKMNLSPAKGGLL